MKKFILMASLILTGLLAGRISRADDLEPFVCHSSSGSAALLRWAVDLYNLETEPLRQCKRVILFTAPQTLRLNEGLLFTTPPPEGQFFGTVLRKCVHGMDPGDCERFDTDELILDFSSYTDDGGDCPIRVAENAWVAFYGITLVVKNPDKAICTEEGDPIPLEDFQDSHAWIHEVTILRSPWHPPWPSLRIQRPHL